MILPVAGTFYFQDQYLLIAACTYQEAGKIKVFIVFMKVTIRQVKGKLFRVFVLW